MDFFQEVSVCVKRDKAQTSLGYPDETQTS